ncbi:putative quinol monooxygenase [Actinoplanes sp. NPDC049265]|uniref:putative quinol monooxygenase n=1 Tax=Actinoplanes sp. NPDC049265 TaxID=3363902 RepID=UPI00371F6A7F
MSERVRGVVICVAAPGNADAVRQIIVDNAEANRSAPGCLEFGVHVDRADGHRIVLVEEWESQELLDAHLAGEGIAKILAQVGPLLTAEPTVLHMNRIA